MREIPKLFFISNPAELLTKHVIYHGAFRDFTNKNKTSKNIVRSKNISEILLYYLSICNRVLKKDGL